MIEVNDSNFIKRINESEFIPGPNRKLFTSVREISFNMEISLLFIFKIE